MSYTMSYTIISKDVNKNSISYYIKCNNGNTTAFKKIGDTYHIYNNSVYSLDTAVKIGCKKKNHTASTVTIKKDALIFKKRFGSRGIENTLIVKSAYSIAQLNASNNIKSIKRISRDSKVIKLKYYKPHYIRTDKYENYKKNGKYKHLMIDGYYKVKDSKNNIFYVRNKSTK